VLDHAALMDEAERLNTNISEVLRRSWREFNVSQKTEQQLLAMEQRLTKAVVETSFVACNLNGEEQADCKKQLSFKGIGW
jgi:hypothetical protein